MPTPSPCRCCLPHRTATGNSAPAEEGFVTYSHRCTLPASAGAALPTVSETHRQRTGAQLQAPVHRACPCRCCPPHLTATSYSAPAEEGFVTYSHRCTLPASAGTALPKFNEIGRQTPAAGRPPTSAVPGHSAGSCRTGSTWLAEGRGPLTYSTGRGRLSHIQPPVHTAGLCRGRLAEIQ